MFGRRASGGGAVSGGEAVKIGVIEPEALLALAEKIERWIAKGAEARRRGDYDQDRLLQNWLFGAYWVLMEFGLLDLADRAWEGHVSSAAARIKRCKAAEEGAL